jgi:hypothetical protein
MRIDCISLLFELLEIKSIFPQLFYRGSYFSSIFAAANFTCPYNYLVSAGLLVSVYITAIIVYTFIIGSRIFYRM